MSALKPQREQAAALAAAGAGGAGSGGGFMASKARKLPASEWEGCLEDALYCAKLCSYAQGMAQLQAASDSHSWQLRLADLATIWCDPPRSRRPRHHLARAAPLPLGPRPRPSSLVLTVCAP